MDNELEQFREYTFSQFDGKLYISDDLKDKMIRLNEFFKDKSYEEKPLLSRVFGKFDKHYFAPTFVKSFMQCPASCFLSYFEKREASPVLNLGSATHKVYERAVKEEIHDPDGIMEIAKEEFTNFNLLPKQKEDFYNYVKAFCNFKMYDDTKLFDGSKNHFAEHFLNEEDLTILGVNLGNCTSLIDRIDLDLNNNRVDIVDYKTGPVIRGIEYSISQYRNQMITYKWMGLKNFPGFEVNCWLYIPAEDMYVLVDTDDLVHQSKWVEEIIRFYDERDSTFKNGYLVQKENQYCKYCPLYGNCSALQSDHDKQWTKRVDDSLLEPEK